MARRCQEKGVGIEVYSDMLASPEFHYERNEFFGSYSFSAAASWSRSAQFVVKRAMDFLLGLVGSLATLLLTPVIALLLRWEDPGPVFYASEFVGCDGRPYYYRKFRTMVCDADALLRKNPQLKEEFDRKYKLEQDPRVLRVGRFLRKYSIDEFPQFFSLLSGKLTFVGPRTVRQEESRRYGELLPRLLSVRPGMTGYWQVMGRQTTSYEERIQMDMFYIEHWSIWLDLVIMGKTVWKVVSADGAY
jgi:lipopolysaccharide/colanic/teichoic acid biosynthesis glycosyltransferase